MKLHFDIQEFCKLDGIEADIPITPELAQKVVQFHLLPLNDIQATLGAAYLHSKRLASGMVGTRERAGRRLAALL